MNVLKAYHDSELEIEHHLQLTINQKRKSSGNIKICIQRNKEHLELMWDICSICSVIHEPVHTVMKESRN